MSAPATVLLTGATGAWGRATLEMLRTAGAEVIAYVRPTERARVRDLIGIPRVRVAFADLRDKARLTACVHAADIVLHLGAMVSPAADADPTTTAAVNIGSARTIIAAARTHPRPQSLSVVMIGSVAQTGPRNPPRHWGRIGDPLAPARFDHYALSKIAAERALIHAGLPRWTWLRQTGIVHPGLLKMHDPIFTHTPLAGVLEWTSEDDSARLLTALATGEAHPNVWGRVWNIGGGQAWRLTNYDFEQAVVRAAGGRDMRAWFERAWFALDNFHGHWFADSDDLAALVDFRRDSFRQVLRRSAQALGIRRVVAARLPQALVRAYLRHVANTPRGTGHWIRENDVAHIDASFGSLAAALSIGDWSTFVPPQPSRQVHLLERGVDESLEPARWRVADLRGAADFRGGALVSTEVSSPQQALSWSCGAGHEFRASAYAVVGAGHWCPVCVEDPATYPLQAAKNAFLAQVVEPV